MPNPEMSWDQYQAMLARERDNQRRGYRRRLYVWTDADGRQHVASLDDDVIDTTGQVIERRPEVIRALSAGEEA